jgi:hypothetical protein
MVQFPKEKIKSNVLADVLQSEFIIKKNLNSKIKLDKSWDLSKSFDDKIVIYKIALVLLAILKLEDDFTGFKNVREYLEKLVFSPDIVDGMFFFHGVKNAMNKLSELFSLRDNAGQWMVWAMSWLTETGINETIPVRSFEFTLMWIDNYVTIIDYLKGYDPE